MNDRAKWVGAMRSLRFVLGYVAASDSEQSRECTRAIEIAFLTASILKPRNEPSDSGRAKIALKSAMDATQSAYWLSRFEKQIILTCLIHAGNMLAEVAKERWRKLAEQLRDEAGKKEIEG